MAFRIYNILTYTFTCVLLTETLNTAFSFDFIVTIEDSEEWKMQLLQLQTIEW
jgi:hypothetical protein